MPYKDFYKKGPLRTSFNPHRSDSVRVSSFLGLKIYLSPAYSKSKEAPCGFGIIIGIIRAFDHLTGPVVDSGSVLNGGEDLTLDIDRHTAELFNELRNFKFCVLERFLDDLKKAFAMSLFLGIERCSLNISEMVVPSGIFP